MILLDANAELNGRFAKPKNLCYNEACRLKKTAGFMRYDQKLCGMVKNDSVPFMGFLEGDEPPMTACGGNFIGGEKKHLG